MTREQRKAGKPRSRRPVNPALQEAIARVKEQLAYMGPNGPLPEVTLPRHQAAALLESVEDAS